MFDHNYILPSSHKKEIILSGNTYYTTFILGIHCKNTYTQFVFSMKWIFIYDVYVITFGFIWLSCDEYFLTDSTHNSMLDQMKYDIQC